MVSAGPGGLIAESSADARIHAQPGIIDKISKIVRCGESAPQGPGTLGHQAKIKIINPPRRLPPPYGAHS